MYKSMYNLNTILTTSYLVIKIFVKFVTSNGTFFVIARIFDGETGDFITPRLAERGQVVVE